MSNVDNENGGAWTENWKQNLLDGWIPQSLHHADKIYIVVASSIIYYIYKYKPLDQASYKYFKTTSDMIELFKSTHPNQCHNWTSWTRISSKFDNKIREEIFQWNEPLSKLLKFG